MADGKVPRRHGQSTIAVHGGAKPRLPGSPVSSPLVQSVNFVQDFGTAEGLLYTRYGNTPNEEIVQERMALLEGSEAALVLSSGAFHRPNRHTVLALITCATHTQWPGDQAIGERRPTGLRDPAVVRFKVFTP